MDIKFKCPACGNQLEAPEDMGGEGTTCPACSREIQIPKATNAVRVVVKKKIVPPSSLVSEGGMPKQVNETECLVPLQKQVKRLKHILIAVSILSIIGFLFLMTEIFGLHYDISTESMIKDEAGIIRAGLSTEGDRTSFSMNDPKMLSNFDVSVDSESGSLSLYDKVNNNTFAVFSDSDGITFSLSDGSGKSLFFSVASGNPKISVMNGNTILNSWPQ